MIKENALDFIDVNGKRTVWPKESFQKHAQKREELRGGLLNPRIMKAKNEPCVIIYTKDKKCKCYYYSEYETDKFHRFTKIIVKEKKSIDIILTAYRPDVIKELKYHKVIWQNPNFKIKN